MKKTLEILKKVFVIMLIVFTVGIMLFTVISVNTFNRDDRTIFGYKAYIVLSDSMKGKFESGDLVLSKAIDINKPKDQKVLKSLKAGDIISFTSQNTDSYGQTVTHKIREVRETDGVRAFVTYGIATDTNDEALVTEAYVQGKYAGRIPNLGKFFNYLRTTPGYILFILIPFVLLIAYQGINCVSLFRQYKAQEMEQLRQEKEALELERQKSQEMMEELLALKAQLAGNTPAEQETEAEEVEE